MNTDVLRAMSARLALAEEALKRCTPCEALDSLQRHLEAIRMGVAELHEPRRRRKTDMPLDRSVKT
jgi:hypothetical protein